MRRAFFLQKGFAAIIAALLLALSGAGLFAEEMSGRVAAALTSIFKQPQGHKMSAALSYELNNLAAAKEKRELLAAFAEFEEAAGFYESASAHYTQAAETAGVDAAEYFSLCLDAARCFMYLNETQKAAELIEKTLAGCFDNAILFRARFYAACNLLSGKDSDAALSQLRVYLSIGGFAPYFPQILFILWYAGGDASAGSRLAASYPSSAEAAIVRGEASMLPRAFWYLMPTGRKPKNESAVAAAATAGAASPSAVAAASPIAVAAASPSAVAAASPSAAITEPPLPAGMWQQTGFFRSRANAQVQAQELNKAGFRVFIREDKRANGDVFFSVLIPEDEAGSTAIRLRENGFESYLVIE